METIAIQLENLNIMEVTASWSGRTNGLHSTAKGKVGIVTVMDNGTVKA
jgi:hypothetical protein